MKGKKEHRVPLSGGAVGVIEEMRREHPGEYLFPGAKPGKPLSNMAMTELMRGMKRDDGKPWCEHEGQSSVPHGFRSTFRDWAAERTHYPGDVVEMALARAVGDKVEAAYRCGDPIREASPAHG